jgi:hypothetical protein
VSLDLLELGDGVDTILRRDDLVAAELSPDELRFGDEGDAPSSNGTGASDASAAASTPGEGSAPPAEVVDDLRRRLAEANAALEDAELARGDVRLRLSSLFDERARIGADLEAARSELDSSVAAKLRMARDERDALKRRQAASALESLSSRRRELEDELEALMADAADQRRELKRLGARDVDHVRDALDALREALAPTQVPSAEAIELADELAALQDRLTLLQSKSASGRSQLMELTARRDAAYDELVAAEAALRAPELDETLVAELEATHDEIFELDGRVSKLSSSRLRRRMNELRDREDELLRRLGFDTWSSYVMGNSTEGAEVERNRRYEVAKATYEFAEDEVAKAASTPILAGSELADVERSHAALLERATRLLDEAGDAEPSDDDRGVAAVILRLRSLRVARAGADVDGAMAELSSILSGLSEEPLPSDPREAAAFTERWLVAEEASIAEQIGTVEEARRRIESSIERLAAELEALPDPVEVATPDDDLDPDVAAADARVAELEEAESRQREVQRLVDELRAADAERRRREDDLEGESVEAEQRVRDAARAVREVEERLRAAESELEAARAAADRSAAAAALVEATRQRRAVRERREHEAAQRRLVDRLEWYVLARLAQQRSLSFVGSVPLGIDDAFADWSVSELDQVFERLARMSEVIQIVYVTDDVDVVAWGRELGHDRASVIDLTPVG